MRKYVDKTVSKGRILVLDDEIGIIDSLKVVLSRNGYEVVGITEPLVAIETMRREKFDLLILDFLMTPIHGDEVVKRLRKFDKDLYILLLTGHNNLAPPLETLRALDIQAYCEKSDKFEQLILLVESAFKSVYMVNTIKKFQEGLNKILQAVPQIYQLQPLSNILEDILVEIMPLVDSENAFILIDNVSEDSSEEENKSIVKGIGRYKTDINNLLELINPNLMEEIGHARMLRQTIKLDEGIILPLNNELMQSIGVMFVESHGPAGFYTDQGVKLLEIYASQAASSLSNAFLHSLVNIKNDELNKTYDQLRSSYIDTIQALRLAVDAKDIYTRGHSDRVSFLAECLGKAMGVSQSDVEILRIAGLFHDIGKIGTADDVLLKVDKLSRLEYEEIKKHPLKGAHILSVVAMFKDVVPIVKYHHERIDGRGYPEGIGGSEIPILARIISVADAFDAMVSDRHYRNKMDMAQAKGQLSCGIGTQFDADVVRCFLSLLDDPNSELTAFLGIVDAG